MVPVDRSDNACPSLDHVSCHRSARLEHILAVQERTEFVGHAGGCRPRENLYGWPELIVNLQTSWIRGGTNGLFVLVVNGL
jgi:hypothetical protein